MDHGRDGRTQRWWGFTAVALALALGFAGCSGDGGGDDAATDDGTSAGDDDDDAAAACFAEPGQWTFHYEGDAGNDRFCPDIPDSHTDEVGGTVTTDPGCDQGCTCTEDAFAPPSCAGAFDQTCDQGGVETTTSCTFDLVSSTRIEGTCDVSVSSPQADLTCGYAYTGTRDAMR